MTHTIYRGRQYASPDPILAQRWEERMQKWRALNEIKLSSDGSNLGGNHPTKELSTRSQKFSEVLEYAQAKLKGNDRASTKSLQTEFLKMECYQYTPLVNSQNIIQFPLNNQQKEGGQGNPYIASYVILTLLLLSEYGSKNLIIINRKQKQSGVWNKIYTKILN